MNLIDANAVNDIFQNGIEIAEEYFLPPDVAEEVELTAASYGKSLPNEIKNLDGSYLFDLGIYLKRYKEMLNKHAGRSFFNMTGFGDISTLAAIHTLLEVFEIQRSEQLFDPTETIVVFTRDGGLTSRINREFANSDIEVRSIDTLL